MEDTEGVQEREGKAEGRSYVRRADAEIPLESQGTIWRGVLSILVFLSAFYIVARKGEVNSTEHHHSTFGFIIVRFPLNSGFIKEFSISSVFVCLLHFQDGEEEKNK